MSNQYPARHEDLNSPLGGTLRDYPNYPGGYAEEVVKTPGRTFSMGFLARRVLNDPVAHEAGAVYVQTVDYNRIVDGKPVRSQYFFNSDGFFDASTGRGAVDGFSKPIVDGEWGERFGVEEFDDPTHDITIGGRWVTPLGVAIGEVEAVVAPYTHGYMAGSGDQGVHPPTVVGLHAIESMRANIGRPS